MSDVVQFPAAPVRPQPTPLPRPFMAGDQVLVCINAKISLWAAWPVALVDDDGFVLAVTARDGKVFGLPRISCDPTYFGLSAQDHDAAAFEALRWRTWRDFAVGLAAFAAVQVVRP